MRWVIDGNNVYGSRPDGWWSDRDAAAARLAERVAQWCRGHDDDVTLVFDAPLSARTAVLAGGNLTIAEATRRGRDAADDEIVALVDRWLDTDQAAPDQSAPEQIAVVTSDRGLRRRLPEAAVVCGVGRFRELICF